MKKRERDTWVCEQCGWREGESRSKHQRPSRSVSPGRSKPPQSSASSDGSSRAASTKSVPPQVELFCMGSGEFGELGLGEDVIIADTPTPVTFQISGKDYVVDVAVGANHTLCRTNVGKLYMFGSISEDDWDEGYVPRPLNLPVVVSHVSSGDSHITALSDQGILYIKGKFTNSDKYIDNEIDLPFLRLPGGSILKESEEFVQVPLEDQIRKVCSGNDHVVCLSEKGRVYTFGCPLGGRLGRLPPAFYVQGADVGIDSWVTPLQVKFPDKRVAIQSGKSTTSRIALEAVVTDIWTSCCSSFAKVVESDGREKIYAWGNNSSYQLGIGDDVDHPYPERALEFERALLNKEVDLSSEQNDDLKWIEIASGMNHVLALDSEGTVYCIGNNIYGQLGLSLPPVAVTGNPPDAIHKTLQPIHSLVHTRCTRICAYDESSMAVTSSGMLYCWGSSASHQLGLQLDPARRPTRATGGLVNREVLKVALTSGHAFVLTGPPNTPRVCCAGDHTN